MKDAVVCEFAAVLLSFKWKLLANKIASQAIVETIGYFGGL